MPIFMKIYLALWGGFLVICWMGIVPRDDVMWVSLVFSVLALGAASIAGDWIERTAWMQRRRGEEANLRKKTEDEAHRDFIHKIVSHEHFAEMAQHWIAQGKRPRSKAYRLGCWIREKTRGRG